MINDFQRIDKDKNCKRCTNNNIAAYKEQLEQSYKNVNDTETHLNELKKNISFLSSEIRNFERKI